MPVYDYECPKCDRIEEIICSTTEHEDKIFSCKECGEKMVSIITAGGQYCSNEDADWLKSVPEVVDKEGGPAAREFVKNPTRTNYKRWMKEVGVRPMEKGEGPTKPAPPDMSKIMDAIMRRHQGRMTDSEYKRKSERILKRGHREFRE